jgi:hypothetical protein
MKNLDVKIAHFTENSELTSTQKSEKSPEPSGLQHSKFINVVSPKPVFKQVPGAQLGSFCP